ncbi:MAG: tRNA pseudouridine13 synthase, partial [Pseudoalteromonas tetraodonis]
MNPIDPPRLLGDALGAARFKSRVEDFQVEEILGFEPSGEGEHCFLWLEKTNRNSNEVAGHLADRLGIRKRLISHCGLKDKHAITRQWFSLHLPGEESPSAEQLEDEGIRILQITRNGRKLRRGSHDGNRFIIRLRDCGFTTDAAESRWGKIITRGVPNYFGPQRFGRRGDNIRQAREMFSGAKEVRDRLLRGIFISSARSLLFNTVVASRVQQQTWDRPLAGEVFGFADNRSLVLPHNLRGDEAQRVGAGELELTAPLWGQGEPLSYDAVLDLEKQSVASHPEFTAGLEALNLRQERRVIRLIPLNASLRWEG